MIRGTTVIYRHASYQRSKSCTRPILHSALAGGVEGLGTRLSGGECMVNLITYVDIRQTNGGGAHSARRFLAHVLANLGS